MRNIIDMQMEFWGKNLTRKGSAILFLFSSGFQLANTILQIPAAAFSRIQPEIL